MSSTPHSPAAAGSRGNGIPRVIVATTALLTFISFWRAAAIVLNDLASSAYYAGGEAEGYIGKTAPWFILAIMVFSYAVRAVYVESCSMFERAAKGHLYGSIDAATHEHAAAFHVHSSYGVREHHDGKDEPRSRLADVAFGLAARVVRRGGQVVQHDGCGPPERNEGQKGCSGDDDTRNAVAAAARGSRAMGSAAHVWVSLTRRLKCSHF